MKPLVIANWKMNPPSLAEAVELARRVERGIAKVANVEVVLAPPFPFLSAVGRVLSSVKLGAQNVAFAARGAYTGEVGAPMLRDLGVKYVIIGHSERRRMFHESDELVNQKIRLTLKAGLSPVLAVGEEERESKEVVPPAIALELEGALRGIARHSFRNLIVAYEPVWAIGTGQADTPDNATRRAIYIRKLLSKRLGFKRAEHIRILYGGSVTSKNAAAFIADDIRGMEGLLVGGASLDAEEFVKIVQAVGRKARRR